MSNALFYVFTVDKVQFYGMLISSNAVIPFGV